MDPLVCVGGSGGSLTAADARLVRRIVHTIKRASRKEPRELFRRAAHEVETELERLRAGRREARLLATGVEHRVAASSIDELWLHLSAQPYLARAIDADAVDALCPKERVRVITAAERALERRIDLLGSGPVVLDRPTDWSVDVKTGITWPRGFSARLAYGREGSAGDVKIPWEISRLHWLLPAGQAYLLTGDERFAEASRDVLDEWIAANPYAGTINWAVAMEAALRVVSWTWLFHACGASTAWSDTGFRRRFLTALYLHGDYIDRHIERSDVNGNHYTADAAGLVVAGLFFGRGVEPTAWADRGWRILREELPRQVHADGVDFEASTAYHRLVAELFLIPALYRAALGLDVPAEYAGGLVRMAQFVTAYAKPNGVAPLWGDADDARVLPLGGSDVGDHRYLPALVGRAFDIDELAEDSGCARAETVWLLGTEAAARLRPARKARHSASFSDGGVYVLAENGDHVFVDAGPIGLAGRGGHGHNDCLSFEAVLDGVPLVTDCGSYVYTASYEWRNHFRSTAAHNTPLVDGQEQNRFDPYSLWRLEDDTAGRLIELDTSGPVKTVRVCHSGYERLPSPVRITRTFRLHTGMHALVIHDVFNGSDSHTIEVPLHLARGVTAQPADGAGCTLVAPEGKRFALLWQSPHAWTFTLGDAWLSPSYGVKERIVRLLFERRGDLEPLTLVLTPERAVDAAHDLLGNRP